MPAKPQPNPMLANNSNLLDFAFAETAVEALRKIRKDLDLPTGKWRDTQRDKAPK